MPHRSFDPRRVGRLESVAWISYYRREWFRFLRAAVGLTRHTFGLPWPATIWGAWLVLRANQQWAPIPDNDPDAARRTMERFYALVGRRYDEPFDSSRAAVLDVEWWRVHREHPRAPGAADDPLVDAIAAFFAYVFDVPAEAVRLAAEQRTLAMRYSDRWVKEGRDRDSPLIDVERAALVRSYAGLLAAVHR